MIRVQSLLSQPRLASMDGATCPRSRNGSPAPLNTFLGELSTGYPRKALLLRKSPKLKLTFAEKSSGLEGFRHA